DMFVGKVEQILSGLRDSGWIVIKRDLRLLRSWQVGPDMFVGKVEQILSGLRDSGWIVIKRDLRLLRSW
ncbi:hypothetical protein V5H41_29650, partial [Salmonella enterica]